MNELQIFENKDFGKIRVKEIDNNIFFVAKDVCDSLDIKNTTQAIQRLDDDERTMLNIGRQGNTNLVNEYGLYNLILASRKPEAKEFKRWITHEVIPSIRKNGGYIAGQENLSDEELMAKALLVANNKIAEKERLLKEAEPKVNFANGVINSKRCIYVNELAKYLKQNGYDTGEKRLFEELRNRGFLISRKGYADYNLPTQRSMDMGLFYIKKSVIIKPDGTELISRTPMITGKGQVYFFNLFMKEVQNV